MNTMYYNGMKTTSDPVCSPGHSHGSFIGHAIPGTMFIIMGIWWTINVFCLQLQQEKNSSNNRQAVFRCRSWYLWPWKPEWPLEPIVKVMAAFIGIVVELILSGHGEWRKLYASDGYFCEGHLNNWQHGAMYGAFGLSGLVDLLGADGKLPKHIESAFLALAFIVEGELMGFHLKGSPLEIRIHLILTLLIFYCVITVLGEMCAQNSFVMSCAKCHAVILQGAWFNHVGSILYLGHVAWDEESMGGVMFAPVLFGTHVLTVAAIMVATFVVIRMFNLDRFWICRSQLVQKAEIDEVENGLENGLMGFLTQNKHGYQD
eukprot:TRINITY_DN40505_c0_g1_i4.p1 TRINITY_DN40505_c0_g1~~TRINITY_DN40505_c0_g1_i4.p1  ORF type:complete len:339 (-),score=30.45 TRINITY_DN40505_c0_g1_i4:64-1014(-)